jgi:hypothetical protein
LLHELGVERNTAAGAWVVVAGGLIFAVVLVCYVAKAVVMPTSPGYADGRSVMPPPPARGVAPVGLMVRPIPRQEAAPMMAPRAPLAPPQMPAPMPTQLAPMRAQFGAPMPAQLAPMPAQFTAPAPQVFAPPQQAFAAPQQAFAAPQQPRFVAQPAQQLWAPARPQPPAYPVAPSPWAQQGVR